MSHDRMTALALLLAIIAAELILSTAGQTVWRALWSGPYPLGQAFKASAVSVGAGT